LDQQRVIAFSTLAVGSLLGLAGIVATSRSARITDLGIAVCLLSLGSYRLRSNSRAVAIFSNLPAEVEEEALVKTETR
jgi:hypothetical protein